MYRRRNLSHSWQQKWSWLCSVLCCIHIQYNVSIWAKHVTRCKHSRQLSIRSQGLLRTSLRMSLSQSHLILEICSWCCWYSTRRSPAFILSDWIMLLRASSVCFLEDFSSAISCRSFTLSWSKKRRASSLASRVSAVRTWESGGRGGFRFWTILCSTLHWSIWCLWLCPLFYSCW